MHVILHTADLDRLYSVFPCNTTHKGPQPFPERCRDGGPSFFCAEDPMIIRTDVRHGGIQPSLRDCRNLFSCSPTLKRWAILANPFGIFLAQSVCAVHS